MGVYISGVKEDRKGQKKKGTGHGIWLMMGPRATVMRREE
jgi:hypothetical protein